MVAKIPKTTCRKRKKQPSAAAKSIRFAYVNSQSINALTAINDRHAQIQSFVETHDPHFLLVAETWLSDLKSPPVIQGYSLVARKDKDSKTGIGGGTCIYRKSGLKTTSPKVPLKLPLSQVSAVRYRDLLIQIVYRSPRQKIDDDRKLYEFLMSTPEKNRVVFGDFNVGPAFTPHLAPTSQSRLLCQVFAEMEMTQVIDSPTREDRILDLLFLSKPDLLLNKHCVPNYIADHHVILAEIKAPYGFKLVKRTIYQKKKLDENAMKLDLACKLQTLPNLIGDDLECETYCRKLHAAIRDTTFEHMEKVKKVVIVDINRPFYTPEIRKLQKLRRQFWNDYCRNKSQANLDKFHNLRRSVEIRVKIAQSKYEMDLAVNYHQKQRAFHRYISNGTKEKSEVGPLMGEDGLIYDDAGMAEELGNYFASACTEVDHYEGHFTHPNGVPVMDDVVINAITLLKASSFLKKNKCSSYDGIRAEDLHLFMDLILVPFVKLFFYCYNAGFCPTYWMTALGIPLLKPDKPREVAKSYRIISVQPITFKWYELVCFRPWLDFVQDKKLLPAAQHGACKGKSTITNLVEMITYITRYFEEKIPVAFISIDQTQAFDRLSYRTIIDSILRFGIAAKNAKFLNSLFQGRKLVVRVGNSVSSPKNIVSGVCQGALASPGIYVAAFASVLEEISSQSYVFVDDLVLIRPLVTSQDVIALQSDLDSISSWCERTRAEVSEHKSSQVIFGRPGWHLSDAKFKINGKEVPRTSLQKHLGFHISEDLTTGANFAKTVSTVASKTYQVKRNFKNRGEHFLKLIWASHLAPIVEYPCILYDLKENLTQQQRLCRIQRWFFKGTVFSDDKGPNCIIRRLKYLKLMFMFKLYHGLIDVPRDRILTFANSQTRHSSRQGLLMPKTRTNAGLRTFGASIVQEWDKIPPEVRNHNKLRSFSTFLKTNHPTTALSSERVAAIRYSWAEQASSDRKF